MSYRDFADVRSDNPEAIRTALQRLGIHGFLVRDDAFELNLFPIHRVYFATSEDRRMAMTEMHDTFPLYLGIGRLELST